jgi:hypothetical protein
MANEWLRLWHDMPNDPKWRTIARIAKQPISLVLAAYIHLLVDASRNVTRGHASVTPEDLASALDVTEAEIGPILDAMQGRVLDGMYLLGWEARQPKREDSGDEKTGAKSAAQRKAEQREREKQAEEQAAETGDVTQSHDESRNVTLDKDKDKDKELKNKTKTKVKSVGALRAPATTDARQVLLAEGVDEQTAADWIAHRRTKRATTTATVIEDRKRACAQAGVSLAAGLALEVSRGWQGLKAEWIANAMATSHTPQLPFQTAQDRARDWASVTTGETSDERRVIDITPIAPRLG